ncbi:hypothetical protein [Pengzhenrongella sicca]|uniref:Uncharacterized protein n=1 Tax=Pengzhenrongella sicca TaxID=2819238 RepID=A0A8A4ZK78_9MICO|nr:hypothetical protein [Pengzhenrongella sicca]QTE30916.1 hypothetical protein J4E96_08325 [Pengzhenrongella sicca]
MSSDEELKITVLNLNGTLTLEEVEDLRERIAAHPAVAAQARWANLQQTIGIVFGNAAELKDYIARREATAEPLGRDSVEAQIFNMNVLRLLMNFVSSAMTLVDHTRNLLRKYEGGSFWSEYESKKAKMVEAPVVVYVKTLRNYMLHRGNPVVASAFSQDVVGRTLSVVVDSKDVLAWEKCPAGAKPYLADHPVVPLRQAIGEYEKLIENLYRWVLDQYGTLHGAEVDEVNDLIRRREAAYSASGEFTLDPDNGQSISMTH